MSAALLLRGYRRRPPSPYELMMLFMLLNSVLSVPVGVAVVARYPIATPALAINLFSVWFFHREWRRERDRRR